MGNRTVAWLLSIVVVAMALLIVINTLPLLMQPASEKFIPRNTIRGMAVFRNKKPFTLNFEQQNKVAEILNRSVKVGMENYLTGETADFDYDLLKIYRFGDEDIEIKPVGFVSNQLLLQSTDRNPKELIRETGPGELDPLLKAASRADH